MVGLSRVAIAGVLAVAWTGGCARGAAGESGSGAFLTGGPPTTAADDASDPSASDGAGDDASLESGGVGGSSGAAADGSGSGGIAPTCGDGVAMPGEDCDGDDLAAQSCADFGFDDGVLVCDAACHVVTDACFTCGDGELSIAEVCDQNQFGGATCTSLGYGGGSLLCTPDCQAIDESGCTALPTCGDGVRNGGEQCDGSDLGGATCLSQGFDMGSISCTASCTLNVSLCANDDANCGHQGDFCIFDENDPQSTCCPAGVGDNVLGICDIFLCV